MKHISSNLQLKQKGILKRGQIGTYTVLRGRLVISGFGSFHEAYRYGLNTFCSEDFLVHKQGE